MIGIQGIRPCSNPLQDFTQQPLQHPRQPLLNPQRLQKQLQQPPQRQPLPQQQLQPQQLQPLQRLERKFTLNHGFSFNFLIN